MTNTEWIVANSTAYEGRWVALDDGELLAAADGAMECLEAAERDHPALWRRAFLLHVSTPDHRPFGGW